MSLYPLINKGEYHDWVYKTSGRAFGNPFLVWKYQRMNLVVPAISNLQIQAGKIVDDAHRIARERGGNIISIIKELVNDFKISSCFYSDFRDILCTGHQLKGKSIEKHLSLTKNILFHLSIWLFRFSRKFGLVPLSPTTFKIIHLAESQLHKLPCRPGTGCLIASSAVENVGLIGIIFIGP